MKTILYQVYTDVNTLSGEHYKGLLIFIT